MITGTTGGPGGMEQSDKSETTLCRRDNLAAGQK